MTYFIPVSDSTRSKYFICKLKKNYAHPSISPQVDLETDAKDVPIELLVGHEQVGAVPMRGDRKNVTNIKKVLKMGICYF